MRPDKLASRSAPAWRPLAAIDRPPPVGCIGRACNAAGRNANNKVPQAIMIELSLWVLGAVVLIGLVAARLARRPRKQNDMELLDFDFDKSKSYEKDGRKFPFSY